MPLFGYYSYTSLIQWWFEGKKCYGAEGYARKSKTWANPNLEGLDLTDKVYLVTGANAGIGFSATAQLVHRGARVHMLCRNATRGEAAVKELDSDKVTLHIVDVSDFSSVRAFSKTFMETVDKLDGLVHNAGVMMTTESTTEAGVETAVATMLGGTQVLVTCLLPLMLKNPQGSRIVNVTSAGQYNVGLETSDLNGTKRSGKKYDGALGYAIIKRQQMALTEQWAQVLKHSNVLVHAMHPGWSESPGLKRSMPGFHAQNQNMFRSPDEGADTITFLLASPVSDLGTKAGLLWFDRESVRKHLPLACTRYSEADRKTLWDNVNTLCNTTTEVKELEAMVGVSSPEEVQVSTSS